MKPDVSTFVFDFSRLRLDPEKDFIAKIPSGLSDKGRLFVALERELRFPYFGHNWDALQDCLRDLSWIKQHRVVLWHDDLPQLDASDMQQYIDVLSSCVRDWKVGEDHQLIVAFPEGMRKTIDDIIQGTEN